VRQEDNDTALFTNFSLFFAQSSWLGDLVVKVLAHLSQDAGSRSALAKYRCKSATLGFPYQRFTARP